MLAAFLAGVGAAAAALALAFAGVTGARRLGATGTRAPSTTAAVRRTGATAATPGPAVTRRVVAAARAGPVSYTHLTLPTILRV